MNNLNHMLGPTFSELWQSTPKLLLVLIIALHVRTEINIDHRFRDQEERLELRFEKINSKFDKVDERFERIESTMKDIQSQLTIHDYRFKDHDKRIEKLEK